MADETDTATDSSLATLLKGVKSGLKDLASLEVQTFTGDIQAKVKNQPIGKIGSILNAITTDDSEIKLVLHTKVSADGDGVIFFQKGDIPEHAMKAHAAALKAGTEVRQGILTLFKDLID